MPLQLLEALPALKRLEALNLSNNEAQNMMRAELVFTAADLAALTRCRSLKRLDLSNTVISFFVVGILCSEASSGEHVYRLEATRFGSRNCCSCCLHRKEDLAQNCLCFPSQEAWRAHSCRQVTV